jgi:hypothetical protein
MHPLFILGTFFAAAVAIAVQAGFADTLSPLAAPNSKKPVRPPGTLELVPGKIAIDATEFMAIMAGLLPHHAQHRFHPKVYDLLTKIWLHDGKGWVEHRRDYGYHMKWGSWLSEEGNVFRPPHGTKLQDLFLAKYQSRASAHQGCPQRGLGGI